MNTPTPWARGLAVLALLCLLPRASALTMTQTITVSGGGQRQFGGGLASGFTTWNVSQFDIQGATLQSVVFSSTADLRVVVTEVWPFDTPSSIVLNTEAYTRLYPHGLVGSVLSSTAFDSAHQQAMSGVLPLDPFGSAQFQSSATIPLDVLITDNLSYFTGNGTSRIDFSGLGSAVSSYGNMTVSYVADLTLTYHYSVPDTHGTWLMLGISALVLLGAHRRLRKVPTA